MKICGLQLFSVFSYPRTSQGRRMAAYFAAFNAMSDGSMKTVLRENFSADTLRRDPLEQRLVRFRGFKKQARTLNPEKLLRADGQKASVLVRDGQEQWLEFTFAFEKGKNGKITAILAAPVDAENVVDLSGPSLNPSSSNRGLIVSIPTAVTSFWD